MHKKIIIGITGASGAIYGIKAVYLLKERKDIETHLVVSEAGKKTISIETEYKIDDILSSADFVYENNKIDAKIASGSFPTDGMIVLPCTIKTLSAIANSYADTLIARAADVALKEQRKLVLAVRETPLHKGHLDLMKKATNYGALILPPIPAFYHKPKTIEDIVLQTVGKIFDYLGIDHNLFRRWNGADTYLQ